MQYKEELDARKELIDSMKKEMLGPGSEPRCIDIEHEIISTRPETRYCVGVLYPQNNTMKVEDDSLESEDIGSKEEISEEIKSPDLEEIKVEDILEKKGTADMEDGIDENVSMSTKLLPSSMGMTFISNKLINEIRVRYKCATYRKALMTDCKFEVTDEENESIRMSSSIGKFFSHNKTQKTVSIVEGIDKKRLRDLYEKEDIDDGFRSLAFKLVEFLKGGYVRVPHEGEYIVTFNDGDYFHPEENLDELPIKICALRHKLKSEYYSYTVMMINSNEGKPNGTNCVFQPELEITTENNGDLSFCDYAELSSLESLDHEEKSNALLYRNKKNYSTGLGVAVNWNVNDEGKGTLKTDYFPMVEVPQMEFGVSEKYNVPQQCFSMKYLSDLVDDDKKNKIELLKKLVIGYSVWIDELKQKMKELDYVYNETAKNHIDNCSMCFCRMKNGLEILEKDDVAWDAFSLANRAMYMQRVQIGIQSNYENVYPDDEEYGEHLSEINYKLLEDTSFWRPFQLAFLLMSIKSISDNNEDRDIVDLIWFPTGGGKTEAYLGLTAFTIFYRRLVYNAKAGGTTVIMRYTLRLLAAQQFTRAATLICACEYIRKDGKRAKSQYKQYELGDDKITIGLWIGGEHTPNRLKGTYDSPGAREHLDALLKANVKNLRHEKDRHNKFQVLKCPWCGTKLVKDISEKGKLIGEWGYHMTGSKKFYISCTQEGCPFESELPLQIVDEELYKNPPTLLFATVDKFALLPWYSEIGRFFAVGMDNRTPELIIQDELHLISGPLGSMVGLYESVVDYLCSRKGIKPKIIASTATICRAKEQCSALYNRDVFQFPPQGIDEDDSFFAKSASVKEKHGRVYIGLLPAGKTKAMMQSRVIAGIMQSIQESDRDDSIKDSYWTLTTYFNSLKELGKCSTIVQNDVRDNIRRIAYRNIYVNGIRNVLRPDELTSRVSTTELNLTLDKLEKNHYTSDKEEAKKKGYASNILLATNMISVGIDVDRLNVMVMMGQPKLTSEYIQASSRVGRKYPGVVFTVYDSARSRDRSHYEQFKNYHESFYKYVEPTGVTPYSEPARNRALHAVVISFLRHGLELQSDEAISTFDKIELQEKLESISDYIIERIKKINDRLEFEVDSDLCETRDEIDVIYEKIDMLAKQTHNVGLEYGNIMGFMPKNEDHLRLMRPFGVDNDDSMTFDTLTSMRNVDTPVNVSVVILEDANGEEN